MSSQQVEVVCVCVLLFPILLCEAFPQGRFYSSCKPNLLYLLSLYLLWKARTVPKPDMQEGYFFSWVFGSYSNFHET